jgi:hypothetical protein
MYDLPSTGLSSPLIMLLQAKLGEDETEAMERSFVTDVCKVLVRSSRACDRTERDRVVELDFRVEESFTAASSVPSILAECGKLLGRWDWPVLKSTVTSLLALLQDDALRSHANEIIDILGDHPAKARLEFGELLSEMASLTTFATPACITHLTNPRGLSPNQLLNWPGFSSLSTHSPSKCNLSRCLDKGKECRFLQSVHFMAKQPNVERPNGPWPFRTIDIRLHTEADVSHLVRAQLSQERPCAVYGSKQESIHHDSESLRALVSGWNGVFEYLGA